MTPTVPSHPVTRWRAFRFYSVSPWLGWVVPFLSGLISDLPNFAEINLAPASWPSIPLSQAQVSWAINSFMRKKITCGRSNVKQETKNVTDTSMVLCDASCLPLSRYEMIYIYICIYYVFTYLFISFFTYIIYLYFIYLYNILYCIVSYLYCILICGSFLHRPGTHDMTSGLSAIRDLSFPAINRKQLVMNRTKMLSSGRCQVSWTSEMNMTIKHQQIFATWAGFQR